MRQAMQSCKELRAELSKLGLDRRGLKADLVLRLQAANSAAVASSGNEERVAEQAQGDGRA